METPAANDEKKNVSVTATVPQSSDSAAAGDAAGQKEKLSVIDYKMVSFSLAGKDYAIDIMKVKEIAKAGRFTYVPNTLPFVLGVYNLRGEIIPIIDLRLFFNIDVPDRKNDSLENLLIVAVGEQTFGIVVDVIDKVVGIQKSAIQPPHPLFGDINIKYIQGVVESGNRLYILLDIDRIFGTRGAEEAREHSTVKQGIPSKSFSAGMGAEPAPAKNEPKQAASKAPAPAAKKADEDYSFIVGALSSMRHFAVTQLNEKWVKGRYAEWTKLRGQDKAQLQSSADADEFLKPFYSPFSGAWWSKAYADSIYKALPDNTAKQIVVWNPGCGKGFETYSLACLLKKRYSEAKIRIYAHDIDLLNVSNAPLLSVSPEAANDWYAPFVTKKPNGELVFLPEIQESIMFEYHDCQNTNALPSIDIVFARDVLSFLPAAAQSSICDDFDERVKGNGIIILGEHELLDGRQQWAPSGEGSVIVYSKQKQ